MSNLFDKAAGLVGSSQPSDELAALMAKYGAALRGYFVRKAGPSVADDLVQEVFLRLQVAAANGSIQDAERYIFTVAKHVFLNRRKLDARRSADLHDSFDEATVGLVDDISPERILTAKQEYSRALTAIADLPPRTRTALFLHCFGRLSYSAIAKQMGVKKSTVQVMIERAMRKITADLEDMS